MVSLLLSVSASGCDKPAPAAGAPPPPPTVDVAIAELREVHPASELTGRIEAIHNVAVRPHASGYVTAVNFKEGSEVAKGAALFSIDARPADAALAHANAELARARAHADITRDDLARAEKLVSSSAIPRAERDTAASASLQAAADVAAAQASVALARLDVEYAQVRAPMAGRTGQAFVSVGDFVAAGPSPAPLTTVVTVDPVYVYFTGDEQTYLRFASHAQDQTVQVGLDDEPGFPHTGKIDFVDNRLDPTTGTIRLRAVVPNPDKRLAPGLFARVQVGEGAAIQAILVDDKAILTDQDRKYVYVLAAGDAVERRDVTLGRLVDGQRVIAAGVKPGERVIINGTQKVFPGSKATAAIAPQKTAAVTPTGAQP